MVKKLLSIFGSLLVVAAIVSTAFVTLDSSRVSAAPTKEEGGTTCAIEKMGWILCPVFDTTGKLVGWAWKWISKEFLFVDTALFDNDSGTHSAWEKMRDIANVAFVIAFIILIYAQVTGGTMGNYGWKRMLPRLILAAILVNSSYYICQILVDLSNIVGFSLKEMLDGIVAEVYKNVNNEYASAFETGNTLPAQALTVVILGSAAVWLLLPIMGSVLMAALASLILTILLLILRKALIVLLIFISPLAFVAYLLPNTESLFKKWFKMFTQILILFPVMALLFGGGQLAGAVLLSSNYDVPTSNDPATKSTAAGNEIDEKKQASLAMALMAILAQVLVLLLAISLTQGAIAGTKIAAGAVSSMSKGLNGRMGGAGKKWDQNSAYNRGKAIRDQAKQNFKSRKFAERLSGDSKWYDPRKARANYTKAAAGGWSGAASATGVNVPGMKGSNQAQSGALRRTAMSGTMDAEQKDISGSQAELQFKTKGNMDEIVKALAEAIEKGNEIEAKAAENMLMGMGGAGVDAFAKAIQKAELSSKNTATITKLREHTSQHHGGIKEKSGDLNQWMSGDKKLSDYSSSAGSFSGLSDEQIAGQSHAALHAAFHNNAITSADAQRILGSTAANKLGGSQRKMMQSLASVHGTAYTSNDVLAMDPSLAPKPDSRRVP